MGSPSTSLHKRGGILSVASHSSVLFQAGEVEDSTACPKSPGRSASAWPSEKVFLGSVGRPSMDAYANMEHTNHA